MDSGDLHRWPASEGILRVFANEQGVDRKGGKRVSTLQANVVGGRRWKLIWHSQIVRRFGAAEKSEASPNRATYISIAKLLSPPRGGRRIGIEASEASASYDTEISPQ